MLMRRLDDLHKHYPFVGSGTLRDMLSRQGPAGGGATCMAIHPRFS